MTVEDSMEKWPGLYKMSFSRKTKTVKKTEIQKLKSVRDP